MYFTQASGYQQTWDALGNSDLFVIPAKAGIHLNNHLDPRFREDDEIRINPCFIKLEND